MCNTGELAGKMCYYSNISISTQFCIKIVELHTNPGKQQNLFHLKEKTEHTNVNFRETTSLPPSSIRFQGLTPTG